MSRWLSRSTIFAIFFSLSALVLAAFGKLTGDYVAMAATLHVAVTARAIAEDHIQK